MITIILFTILFVTLLTISLHSKFLVRISSIVFICAGVLAFNTLYFQSIGSGTGIYSGLFQAFINNKFDLFYLEALDLNTILTFINTFFDNLYNLIISYFKDFKYLDLVEIFNVLINKIRTFKYTLLFFFIFFILILVSNEIKEKYGPKVNLTSSGNNFTNLTRIMPIAGGTASVISFFYLNLYKENRISKLNAEIDNKNNEILELKKELLEADMTRKANQLLKRNLEESENVLLKLKIEVKSLTNNKLYLEYLTKNRKTNGNNENLDHTPVLDAETINKIQTESPILQELLKVNHVNNIQNLLIKADDLNDKKNKILNMDKDVKSNSLLPESITNFNFDFSGYTAEQVAGIGLFLFGQVIVGASISIGLTIFGDYLIIKFKLESKYPKLAKFIAIRRKFQRYYIILNIFYLVLVGLILLATGIGLFYI